jgi:tetratricopeptide (TPR) repeat protein
VSHEALGEVLLKPLAPVLTARLLAETVHRVWLFASSADDFEHTECFERAWRLHEIPEAVVATLLEWSHAQHIKRNYAPPRLWAEWANGQLRQELGFLLQGWREADGIIPFIAPKVGRNDCLRAVGLPFRIRGNLGTHGPRSLGHGGVPCELQLDEGVAAALELARREGWISKHECFAVELTTLEGSCGIPVSGASCGLPVALARGLRSEGLRVPVFELAASGTLGCGGTSLASHRDADTLSQKEKLLRSLGVKRVILPGNGSSNWPCGEDITPLMRNLFAQLKPVAQNDAHDALLKKVNQHAQAMHSGHEPAELVERLMRKMLAVDLPESDSHLTDVRAEALLTLSAALSHLGRPSDARDANAQALELAQQLPSSWRGLALARTAVILQDLGEYEAAMENCDQALDAVTDSRHDLEALELDMKASGTKGQVLACWGLCVAHPSRSLDALGLLEHAVHRARELDAQCRHRDEPEEPRNLAYVYLWHALHASERAGEFWDEAWGAAEKMDVGKTTQQYLLRHRWLAVYRNLLVEGKPPCWMGNGESFEMPEGGWMHSTALKYRGTWHAFEGRLQEAIEDFSSAIWQLRRKHGDISLFEFFAATTALQAGQSLQHLDPDRSTVFLQQALAHFEECETQMSWFSGRPFAGTLWIKRARTLIAGHESVENPQLHYPY